MSNELFQLPELSSQSHEATTFVVPPDEESVDHHDLFLVSFEPIREGPERVVASSSARAVSEGLKLFTKIHQSISHDV